MLPKLLALILPLSLDAFAVAAALGVATGTARQRLRVSVLFAAFEAGMPLVGLAIGAPLGHAIGRAADYVAIGVLVVFGVYTMCASEEEAEERIADLRELSGLRAITLGLSISLDELAIGFTLGLLRVPIALVTALIAAQAFVFTQLGMRIGARVNERMREGAERLGGLALTGVAVALLADKFL